MQRPCGQTHLRAAQQCLTHKSCDYDGGLSITKSSTPERTTLCSNTGMALAIKKKKLLQVTRKKQSLLLQKEQQKEPKSSGHTNQDLLHFSLCPPASRLRVNKGSGRVHGQDSWPKLTKGISHTL